MDRPTRHWFAAFIGIALIVLVWLLPDFSPGPTGPNAPIEAYRGRIESITFPSADQNGGGAPVPIARVRILDGPHADQVLDANLAGPGGSQDTSTYAAGQEVVVTFTVQADGSDPYIEVSDHWRIPQLGLLALLFAAAVVFVGGWHGIRALVALGLTAVVIVKILIPAIVAGVPPVPLAVVVASAVTIVTILLTEGWSWTSISAILGTTSALAITALLAALATAFLGFTYTAGSDLAFLTVPGGGGLDLRGVLLAAIILGAVGVLDDVTVTQAVLVEELGNKGRLRGPALVLSAMRIGRSHIAATVNTLFLAYISVGLPLLIVLFVSHQPSGEVLNDETIATEIVRTLVGSLGIIAAIPLTTFIAGLLIDQGVEVDGGWETFPTRRLPRVLLTVVGIAALLVATTLVSLGGSARAPLTSNVFGPSPSPSLGGTDGSETPAPSDGSSAGPGSSDSPAVYAAGEVIPITVDGTPVGSVTIDPSRSPTASPRNGTKVSVVVHYVATGSLPLPSRQWELLLGDGSLIPLAVQDPSAMQRTLTSGERLDVQATADLPNRPTDIFVVYVDVTTSDILLAVPID
jgi:uncharacterized membrane protein